MMDIAAGPETLLLSRLDKLGIAHKTFAHAPVFTVEESSVYCGHIPGTHTKNLFLEDRGGGLWLVVARAEIHVDLKALSAKLHSPRFSFGTPDLLMKVLGVPSGSVTPFAIINDKDGRVRVILDIEMLRLGPVLNFHPLRNDRTTTITADDLVRFLRDAKHEPLILPLPERHS